MYSESTDARPFSNTELRTQTVSSITPEVGNSTQHTIPKSNLPSDFYYKMNHKRRGEAFIFNHEFFAINNLESRIGTNVDCRKLNKILKKLRFKVKVFKDLTFIELKKEINKASSKDYSKHNCILVVILTHGENNHLFTKDQLYKSSLIWESFAKNRTLEHKPKIFFIQACQGTQQDEGLRLVKIAKTEQNQSMNADVQDSTSCAELELNETSTYELFNIADFLLVFSTIPNYVSWRSKTFGAWFIQALIEKIEMHGNDADLLLLLTLVNQKVSVDFETYENKRKQVLRIHSTLTRLLVLKNKKCLSCSIF
ncbi:caspase-1-like [Arctopsyche grandis]|uniref:caspase-1-like n=1 Tax=Arctopsyche grandis TaxID=121162 RepID=UPI00406D7120